MIIAQCGYYRMRLPLMWYFDNCETGGCAVDSTSIIECICCWCDLLGYGSPFVESKWDLNNEKCRQNFQRIVNVKDSFHSSWSASPVGTKLVFNDGYASTIDCLPSPDNYDNYKNILYFLEGAIKDYESLNSRDKQYGFPGARSIISLGQRFSYDTCSHSFDMIFKRTISYYPEEFQMNTAFSKAFIMEEAGSKAKISGSNMYFDASLFSYLNNFAKMTGCSPFQITKEATVIKLNVFEGNYWFADLCFDSSPIRFGGKMGYENRGIETTLYRYIEHSLHSIIDDAAFEASYADSLRAKLSEEDAE